MRVGRAEVEADLYEVLGVPPWATEGDIRRAHRRLAMRWHPDRNRRDASAEGRMKLVNLAASVLLDPVARARYDRLRFPWSAPAPVPPPPRPPASSVGRPARPWRAPIPTKAGPRAAISPRVVAIAVAITAFVAVVASATGDVHPVGSAGYRVSDGPRHVTMWAE